MSIKRNYGYNLFNSLLNIAFPIVSFPYAARILSPDGIGQTQFIFSYSQYFALLAAFGIPIYGIKAISEAKGDQKKLNKVTTELISISFINVLAVLIIYTSSIFLISEFKENINNYLLAGSLIFFSVFNVDWFFGGKEQFKTIALRSIMVKIVSLVLLFSFVKTSNDLTEYLFILVFLYVGNYIINFFFLIREVRFDFKNIDFKKHLKPLALILSMTIATTIYTTLDSVLLGFLSNAKEVGYYTAAVKLSKVSIPILTSLGMVIIPKVTSLVNSGNRIEQLLIYKKSFSFISLLAIPMCFGIYLLSEEAVILFSGQEFCPAITDVIILATLPLFIGFGHFAAFQILLPLNNNKALLYSTLIGMFIFFSVCFLLVPSQGSTGAAIANAGTELIVTCCYFFFVPSYILAVLPWKKFLNAFVASLPFIGIVFLLQQTQMDNLSVFILAGILCSASYALIQHYLFKESLIVETIGFLRYGRPK